MLREQLVPLVTLQLGEQRPWVVRASPSLLQVLTENVPLYLLPPWLYPASLLSASVAPRTSMSASATVHLQLWTTPSPRQPGA